MVCVYVCKVEKWEVGQRDGFAQCQGTIEFDLDFFFVVAKAQCVSKFVAPNQRFKAGFQNK